MNKKEKNKMFKDAFVNDDKDFRKDVTIKVEGQDIVIATIRFLTQLEVSDIYMKLSKGNNITEEDIKNNNVKIDLTQFVYHLMANSIDEWIFDKEINVENVKFLKDKYRNPIMEEVNALRTLWENKDK